MSIDNVQSPVCVIEPLLKPREASSYRPALGMTLAQPLGKARSFFGWRVDAAAFAIAVFGWGLGFYGPPVYLEVIRQSHGWPITLVSGAVTLHFLVGLILIPNLPSLFRRFGLPATTFAGSIVMALGVLGWALCSNLWQLYLASFFTGVGWSVLGAVTINAIIAPWFKVKRPFALGVAFNGGSVGGVIFSPFWIFLIHRLSFPVAALSVGVVMVLSVGGLALFVLRRGPQDLGQSVDGDDLMQLSATSSRGASLNANGPLLRDRAFLTLCIGMTLALFAQTGMVAHLVSVLTPALGAQGAGLAAGLSGVAAVVGRLAVGWRSSSKSDWRSIASFSLLVQAIGCSILTLAHGANVSLLILGVVLFGFGVGNASSVPPVIANLEFEGDTAVRVVSLTVAISQGGYALAPMIFGFLRQTASNQTVFLAAAAIELAAIGAYVLGRRVQMPALQQSA